MPVARSNSFIGTHFREVLVGEHDTSRRRVHILEQRGRQLMRFDQYAGHVGDIPVAEVRREHRLEFPPARQQPRVERGRIHPVVGLAAIVEVRHQPIEQVVDALDVGCREIVDAIALLYVS